MGRKMTFLVGVVVAVVATLYFTGRLDYALYPVGLNFHTCARNGFGATFCGSDLTAYENRVRGIQRQAQQIQRTLTQNAQQTETAQATTPPVTPASTTGHVTLAHMPDSSEDQATITVGHQCASSSPSCDWLILASQYPGGTPCPPTFDYSHAIGSGPPESVAGTDRVQIAFAPAPGDSSTEVCAYAQDGAGGLALAN
jgi:hypothetical protein